MARVGNRRADSGESYMPQCTRCIHTPSLYSRRGSRLVWDRQCMYTCVPQCHSLSVCVCVPCVVVAVAPAGDVTCPRRGPHNTNNLQTVRYSTAVCMTYMY